MFLFLALLLLSPSLAFSSGADVQQDIAAVLKQDAGSRAAWERLCKHDGRILPDLLEAMNTKETSPANWLRLAFDEVARQEQSRKGRHRIDVQQLRAFVQDTSKHGRARRLALDLLEDLEPGAAKMLHAGFLDDLEFRFEAVALVLERGQAQLKAKAMAVARATFTQAFEKSRDVQQARAAAAGLEKCGPKVSVAQHLGFLMDWHIIGPFDGKGQKGFHLDYPPQTKVDLKETLPGQGRMVAWKPFRVKEPAPTSNARHQALVDLRTKDALGDADDAVAFAYTEFVLAKAQRVEFRGSADDNFTVWVNGKKEFAFEEYRNGVRHDRHRFAVDVRAGRNSVLVKICQTPAPNPEPNWEFFLRVVDATGKGIEMQAVK